MNNTKADFAQRKIEIDSYFSFLNIIDKDETYLKYISGNVAIEEKISSNIQRILIANSFLILYNLIEATVRNSIVEIYEKIQEESVSYGQLSTNLKKVWLRKKTKNLKEGNFNISTLQSNIEEIIEQVVNSEIIALSRDDIDIAGNIDADKIRSLAQEIGFAKSSNGQNLVTIKNKRNGLAHGNHTFYDVGKDYTVNDLNDYKQQTFDYLLDVINSIESFINDQKYKNP